MNLSGAMSNFHTNITEAFKTLEYFFDNFYDSSSDRDKIIELSCIGLEFCSYLNFIHVYVDGELKYDAPDEINTLLISTIAKKAIFYTDNIKNNRLYKHVDPTKYMVNRCRDYAWILKEKYVPCGFYLLKDYPRYSSETEDLLMRYSVALGDFSLYYIKCFEPAELKDIEPLLLLDISDMTFYTALFGKIKELLDVYFANYVRLVDLYSSNTNNKGEEKTPNNTNIQNTNNKTNTVNINKPENHDGKKLSKVFYLVLALLSLALLCIVYFIVNFLTSLV